MLTRPLLARPSALFFPTNTSSRPGHRRSRRHPSRSRAVEPPSLLTSRPGLRSRPLSLPRTPLPPKSRLPPPPLPLRQYEDLLADTLRKNSELKTLIGELSKEDPSPLALLKRDGDWDGERFWVVARFLNESGLANEIIQVFDAWSDKDKSRVNIDYYSQLVRLLCETGSMDEAITLLGKMETDGLTPSISIYNSLVAGFASKGDFKSANETISKMGENGLTPVTETYNRLIRAYGIHKMYDEMSKFAKKMELEGCTPNEVTYNLLIAEYARGKLLGKMESVCSILRSKNMHLLQSTLVVMLEAYADLGLVEKVQKVCQRVLNCQGYLKESLIRKVARVYIESYRFAQLEEFGNEIGSKIGRTQLYWCLMLLSSAGLMSQKGMESVIIGMENENLRLSATHINILALAFSKMKDFRSLDILLSSLNERNLKPDIITVGVLFDACSIGYDGTRTLEVWRRHGFLDNVAEMDTDPLVLSAYGKGCFLRSCEELYSSIGSKSKEHGEWKYSDLINMVFTQR